MIKHFLLAFIIILTILLGGNNNVFAQSAHSDPHNIAEEHTIGFNENLDGIIKGVTSDTRWSITGEGVSEQGRGAELLKYDFRKPGVYTVTALETDPEHGDTNYTLTLSVKPIHIEWHWDEAKWLEQFSKQKNYSNTSVSVPVMVHTYNRSTQTITEALKLNLAGIDCNLTGIAKTENLKAFSNGETRDITFLLNGTVGDGVYAMLDLTDSFGRTTSFSMTQPIR